MNAAEITQFLHAPRHAVVATIGRDGMPQLTPVWYLFEDDRFYISIGRNTVKHRNLRRDPRLSLCIDGGREDVRTVTAYGTAELLERDNPLAEPMRIRIIRHYIADPVAADAYLTESAAWESTLLVVTPNRILTQNFND